MSTRNLYKNIHATDLYREVQISRSIDNDKSESVSVSSRVSCNNQLQLHNKTYEYSVLHGISSRYRELRKCHGFMNKNKCLIVAVPLTLDRILKCHKKQF